MRFPCGRRGRSVAVLPILFRIVQDHDNAIGNSTNSNNNNNNCIQTPTTIDFTDDPIKETTIAANGVLESNDGWRINSYFLSF
jgi:hypothetical protein